MGKQGEKKLKLHFIETDKKLKVLREARSGHKTSPREETREGPGKSFLCRLPSRGGERRTREDKSNKKQGISLPAPQLALSVTIVGDIFS